MASDPNSFRPRLSVVSAEVALCRQFANTLCSIHQRFCCSRVRQAPWYAALLPLRSSSCVRFQSRKSHRLSPPHFHQYRFRDLPNTREYRSEEHTSELQSPCNLLCGLQLEKARNLCQVVSSERAEADRRRKRVDTHGG